MAKVEQLLKAVADLKLRAQLEAEVASLKDRTRFGLVYERHLPETVIVGDTDPLKVGDHVRPRQVVDVEEDFRVLELNGKNAKLVSLKTNDENEVEVKDLLVVKRFGDPAYASLEPLGSVRRGDGRSSHAVINGENFHSLQTLTLLCEGQVDCIYIDPPYNTGARDWKYNNDYVDDNDTYRHSKWLSFMEKRLHLARRLLKPDGVLIVTIDWNEVHHLGLLLEEEFPGAHRQLVSIVIQPSGSSGEGLSRVEEYAFFCYLGDAAPVPTYDDMLLGEVDAEAETEAELVGEQGLTWESLLRRGNAWYRASRPNLCYPVLLNEEGTSIVKAGEPFSGEDESERATVIDGYKAAWPVRKDGKLGIWRVEGARLNWLAERGYAFVGGRDDKRDTWALKYLMSGTVDAIAAGAIEITGRGDSDQVLGRVTSRRAKTAKTVWKRGRHNAGGSGGTQMLNALLGERNIFSFPKSIYAVRDCLEVAIGDRKDALILDFFAGSGTTLHATCLMNAEDGGKRRSILVTNNEVSVEMKQKLAKDGYYRGQPEYERHGIFEAATRPRCEAAITGVRPDGEPVEGAYLDGRSYADGFEENVEFFRLDYLDGDKVELGQAFDSIHPLLWLAAGARGPMPEEIGSDDYFISPECGYAVLLRDDAFRDFEQALAEQSGISHVFLVTDSEDAYAEMRERVGVGRETAMLYRDFLRHFRRGARA